MGLEWHSSTFERGKFSHYFTRILGRLRFCPFANLGVTETVEGMDGVGNAFWRTDYQDFDGGAVRF